MTFRFDPHDYDTVKAFFIMANPPGKPARDHAEMIAELCRDYLDNLRKPSGEASK